MSAPAVTIKDAVVAAIVAAGITGIDSTSVKPRKVAQRFQTDPSPVCIVVVEDDRLVGRTNMTRKVAYPFTVLLVRKGAATVAKSDNWMEEARHTLWGLLDRQLFLGIDGIVRRCEYESDPPFDRKNFDEDDDVGGQRFIYTAELTSAD